jgi:hypothetical protein
MAPLLTKNFLFSFMTRFEWVIDNYFASWFIENFEDDDLVEEVMNVFEYFMSGELFFKKKHLNIQIGFKFLEKLEQNPCEIV